jgi:hypothetical protein
MHTEFAVQIGGRVANRVFLADDNGFGARIGFSFPVPLRSDCVAMRSRFSQANVRFLI